MRWAAHPRIVVGELLAGDDAAAAGAIDLVGQWVALLDEAEALLASAVANPDDLAAPSRQRAASRALDTLYASEHAMTPSARRAAREYVWRRDHADEEPPPNEVVLRRWEQCLCRRCHAARVLGRPVGDGPSVRAAPAAPSTTTATHAPQTPQAPQVTPGRRIHAVQAALFPVALRQRRHHMHHIGA